MNNIYDLVAKSNGITAMSFGYLEKYFDLSNCKTQDVKYVKAKGKNGIIILRYSYYNNSDAQRYENYIDKYYQRIAEN